MKKVQVMGAVFLALAALAVVLYLGSQHVQQTFFPAEDEGYTVILDAGHGGVDGGAVSADGLAEREITLAIAQMARDYLELSGIQVVMTRETNDSIHDSSAVTLREQKNSDLKNRVKIAGQHPDAMLVSIHLNSFPDTTQHGAQVFYKGNDTASQQVGQVAQETLKEVLNPENQRVAKAIPEEIYLMRNINNTAVLMECGFLSNPEEAALLGTEDYQQDVAFAIYLTVMRYITQQNSL